MYLAFYSKKSRARIESAGGRVKDLKFMRTGQRTRKEPTSECNVRVRYTGPDGRLTSTCARIILRKFTHGNEEIN